jgi:hypothetical protein
MTSIPLQPTPLLAPATVLSPLSPAQLTEFQAARTRSKKIRRATFVALTDAWFTAAFAFLTILTGIFSPISILLGAALAFIAFNSFRGAKRLKQFDPSASKLLALNQLALAAILTLYAAYSIFAARHGDPALNAAVGNDAALGPMLGNLQNLTWYLTLALYGGLAAASIVAQSLTALYYITRKKLLIAYLHETPPWIISLQKAGA